MRKLVSRRYNTISQSEIDNTLAFLNEVRSNLESKEKYCDLANIAKKWKVRNYATCKPTLIAVGYVKEDKHNLIWNHEKELEPLHARRFIEKGKEVNASRKDGVVIKKVETTIETPESEVTYKIVSVESHILKNAVIEIGNIRITGDFKLEELNK